MSANINLISKVKFNLVLQGGVSKRYPRSFGFSRKLTRTKNQQITYKVSKHNGRTVFSRISTSGENSSFILYPLFILISLYLLQPLFSPLPPPPLEYAVIPAWVGIIIRLHRPLTRLSSLSSLSANHHASRDTYVVLTSEASVEDLITTSTINDDNQLRPIQCRFC